VRDDEIRRLLTEANPWWRNAAVGGDPTTWATGHRVLKAKNRHDLGYHASVLDDVKSEPIDGRLTVLAGPRRVGKSVALMEVALALCGRPDVDPRQVIHVPCDQLMARDLRRVLSLAPELTRSIDHKGRLPRAWLLDEVTQVRGWTATIKSARDGTDFGDDTVVLTGSRWVNGDDIASDLLAGRAGETEHRRLRVLLPMAFHDYLRVSGRGLSSLGPVHPSSLQSEEARQLLEGARFDVDAYDVAWQEYLTCGGFPRAVAEQLRGGGVSTSYARDLVEWLNADVDPEAPRDSITALLTALEQRLSSPMNARDTAERLGYDNRPTFERRIERLTQAFGGLKVPQRHGETGASIPGSQSKYYLTDPLLAWLPRLLRAGAPQPDMTRLTEMTMGVALARALEAGEEGRWNDGNTIGYTRTGTGNEVDLAPVPVATPSGTEMTVPIESKWVDDGWRSESLVLSGKYGCGIMATKSVLEMDDPVWAVPAPLLALLLQ
jgi:predicted AAA+ superfamily ATPase